MTHTEIKNATLAALWTRLEAVEFADDPRNYDERHVLENEISRRERPWAALEASFDAAIEDEYHQRAA